MDISSSSGTVSQVKESAARLLAVAKKQEIPMFIVGHVNKDGAIAGPKVMEHIVDTVLYFEGDKINVVSETKIEGTLTYENDIVTMNINIKTDLELLCSRCLDAFIYPVDINIEERFTNNSHINNDDIVAVGMTYQF